MASYNVLVRDAPADLTLVRDGFSMSALICGPIWFVWHRAWMGVLLWLFGVTLIGVAAFTARIPPGVVIAALFLFAALMAMEASELRKRSLTRRGYRSEDVVEAHGVSEAEIRFFARQAAGAGAGAPRLAPLRPGAQKAETVGLFLSGT